MITPDDITVQDFKDQFQRDFNYLPVWDVNTAYSVGDLIFYAVNSKFYNCVQANTGIAPTNSAYWTLNPTPNKFDYVSDADILRAFAEAKVMFNQNNNNSDAMVMQTFLYLAAHFLVGDINAGGVESQSQGIVSNRTVGNVSESYVVPEWMQKEGYSFFVTTYYGRKYLTLTRGYRVGNVFTVPTPRHTLGLGSIYNFTNVQ